VLHPGLGQARRQVEEADQARILAGPVRHDKDWSLVRTQTGQNVVAVLPDGVDDDERRGRWDALEDLDPHPLAVDEAVALVGIRVVHPLHGPAEVSRRCSEVPLQLLLCGPAPHIGAEA
jgi:hypothetical protein